MNYKELIIVILSWFICFHAEGQAGYVFKHVTAIDGLPDNHVEGVFFIPDGRLCIRTSALLCLYDGCKYTSFAYPVRKLYHWEQGGLPLFQYVDREKNLVWIKGRNVLHVFDLERERYVDNVDSLLVQDFGVKSRLRNMFVDNAGRQWFVSGEGDLLMHADGQTRMMGDKEGDGKHVISLNGTGNCCWIVYDDGILRCMDTEHKSFVKEERRFAGRIKPEARVVLSMLADGSFWMMWDDGMVFYDAVHEAWITPIDLRQDQKDVFTTLDINSEGNAYVGTGLSGLHVISRKDFAVSHYSAIPLIDGSTIRNDITNITVNRATNDLWIGFMFQGLAYHYPHMNKFSLFNHETLHGELHNESVRCMAETADGNILLGTLKGLYRFNPHTGHVDIPIPELSDKLFLLLFRDSRGRIWAGTLYDGLYRIEQGRVTGHWHTPGIEYRVFRRDANYNTIRAITEDHQGRLYVSVTGGVCLFYPETGKFTLLGERHPELAAYTECTTLAVDDNGQLIVGSTDGLYYYNLEKQFVWRPETDAPDDRRFFHSNTRYNCILRDSRNLYWFGTQNGLNIVDMKKDRAYCLDTSNGLSNSVISTIVEDRTHNVWVSTTNGINRVAVTRQGNDYRFDVTAFNESDGLLTGEYYSNSGMVAADGTVYFGGLNGFSAFNPRQVVSGKIDNHPLITGLYLFNTPILPGHTYNGRIILEKSLAHTQRIDLEYDENFLTIEFSGLNFSNPDQTYYKYRLEGFENGWNEASFSNTSGKAVYTGLAPGRYVFTVYAAGGDKRWGQQAARIEVVVHPPFWDTTFARILYALIAVGLFVWLMFYLNRRNRQRMQRMQQEEAQRQKEELDQMKFRFFTNISHEFRTPLTLIITPLEAYLKKMQEGEDRRRLSAIYRNALNLLALVNQLLDFRKLEMKGERLKLMNGDFIEFVRQACLSFREVADEKGITLHLDTDSMEELYMYFDRDKIHKVLNNLLSNAFKFTPRSGVVTVDVEKMLAPDGRRCVRLRVSDTGIGISKGDLPHIFERFYQAQTEEDKSRTGSGIGLHLIKEYVAMHEGEVSVESTQDIGSTFTVVIPTDMRPEEESADTPVESTEPEPAVTDADTSAKPNEDNPLLLVVEDNREFREFLREQLSGQYRIIDAPDGEEGDRMAVEQNPALIISDIMMPRVDGIELCRRIKTNVQTSHIPVILLTARASDQSKAQGYDAGADSYISKPFSIDVLLTRIRKLIEQQRQRQQMFHKEIVVTPSSITITSLDEQIVQKALQSVEKNMDDTEYSVEQLASDLAMTRATLYRKLQGITGQTPKDFIRSIRLKRAAQLLTDSDLSVSEIADRTGFSTPRHFAKLFKEAFGVLPSQYGGRKQEENKTEEKT